MSRISLARRGGADGEVDDAEQGTLDATKPKSRGCLPKCGRGKKKSSPSKGPPEDDDNESCSSDASPVAADAKASSKSKGPGKHAGNTTWPSHVFSEGILNPVHPLRKVCPRRAAGGWGGWGASRVRAGLTRGTDGVCDGVRSNAARAPGSLTSTRTTPHPSLSRPGTF